MEAVEEQSWDRTALSGDVKVIFPDQEHDGQRKELVSVVDWEVPENDDFLLSHNSRWRGETIRRGGVW